VGALPGPATEAGVAILPDEKSESRLDHPADGRIMRARAEVQKQMQQQQQPPLQQRTRD